MSSKLLEHFELIRNELNDGKSIKSISEKLTNLGCITSRQNLEKWLKTRRRRIISNLVYTNPLSILPNVVARVPDGWIPVPVNFYLSPEMMDALQTLSCSWRKFFDKLEDSKKIYFLQTLISEKNVK